MAARQARLTSGPGCQGCEKRPETNANEANFQDIPHLRRVLPRQFDEATNRTIEQIDVLWPQRDAIIAAFEVEHTTAIYSSQAPDIRPG